ncbi:hypothetical protein ACO9S2_07080 [Nitrospira sp. NS4]|uniref:hypothetical protein n=1 Tax=Nitrospira sp. NS4 TaxID=3414498 RepID=UPI003C2ECA9C
MAHALIPAFGFISGLLLCTAVIAPPLPAWAEEPVPIQAILEEPRIFHLRQVTMQGVARDVQPLDPYKLPNENVCYGAYLFKLEDDTGVMSVAVLGICGRPLVRDPEIEDGQRVEVSATIQAPSHGGYYLSFQGLKVVTEEEGLVQAVATRILPVIE